jgi:DNA-binding MarR family transcriptional regulator
MSKKLDKETVQAISDLGRQFSDATILMHEAIAGKAGLSGTDHKYVGILMRHGAMTAGELSRLTGLTTGAVTGLIDRLESKRLVKRQFDKEDRRKILIVPDTVYATELLGDAFAHLQKRMVSLIATLSDKETEIIKRYLLSTIEVMKEVTNKLNNTK